MSSTLLWVLLPLLVGAGMLLYTPLRNWLALLGGGLCLFLAWAAWQLPIGVVMQLGRINMEIAPTLVMFGRSFTLGNAHTPLLSLLYLLQALWIFGSHLAKPGRLFVPLSLICLALLVAALAVQPFLYAALLLAMAALMMIPLLAPPGSQPGLGLQRYIQFQVFAVPFILFTGWILSGVEANPGNMSLVLRAGVLLALGFGFLLALFPFHSWVPLLAGQSHPYVFGYLISFLPAVAMIFGLGFLDRYGWLRESVLNGPWLLAAGGLAALLGGLWAAGQQNLGRMFGYAAILAGGYSLQAIGLGGAAGVQAFFALFIAHSLALWAGAFALSRLLRPGEAAAEVAELTQQAPQHPLAAAVLLVSLAALAGLPLLAVFPGRLAVLDGAATRAAWTAVLSLLGSLGLLTAGYRLLAATLAASRPRPEGWVEEAQPIRVDRSSDLYNPYIWAFGAFSGLALVVGGLFPQLLLSAVPRLATLFPQLFP